MLAKEELKSVLVVLMIASNFTFRRIACFEFLELFPYFDALERSNLLGVLFERSETATNSYQDLVRPDDQTVRKRANHILAAILFCNGVDVGYRK